MICAIKNRISLTNFSLVIEFIAQANNINMIKQLTINCNFKTSKVPVSFYVGDPSDDNHPLHFQAKWLGEKKGGTVPKEILDSFTELQKIAIKNHVSFQELCAFAIEEINSTAATNLERNRINKNLGIVQQREEQKRVAANAGAAQAPQVNASQQTSTEKK